MPKGKSVAGLFAESIQGVGGSVQFPKGYLKRAFDRVRELGGVCISDEVRTLGGVKLTPHTSLTSSYLAFFLRFKPDLVGPETTFGALKVMEWCLTLSPWPRVSAMASLWQLWLLPERLVPL